MKNYISRTHPRQLASVVWLAALTFPLVMHAQLTPPAPPIEDVNYFYTIACDVFTWLFTGAIMGSVILAVIAAYKYLTAGGNPENTKSANKMLLYAGIAVMIAVLARGLPIVISKFLGTTGSTKLLICP